MRQKKNKYILMLIISSVLISCLMAVISVMSTNRILQEHSVEMLDVQCQKAAMEFEALLGNLEQSVKTITSEALYSLDDLERFKTDPVYVQNYTENLHGLMLYAARNTEGTMSAYIRYNPELVGPLAGIFLTRNDEAGDFVDTHLTNLYAPEGEDVLWWTAPVEAGEAVWIGPYHNFNVDYNMISYVMPYYINGNLVGIVGMDIDCEYIKELFDGIRVYKTGFGILIAEGGQVVAHKNYELFEYIQMQEKDRLQEVLKVQGNVGRYQLEEVNKTIAYVTTKNNMLLGIIAPNDEIYAGSRELIQRLTIVGLTAMTVFSMLTVFIIKKLYRLAENDELTGIYNRKYFMTCFQDWMKGKKENYSLFLFDIDFFKQINDNYGHNAGDFALKEIAQLTQNMIGKGNIVARWGGDEFIGIIPQETAAEMLENLRGAVESLGRDNHMPFTISIGYGDMVPGQKLEDITELADKALYISKDSGRNCVTYYNADCHARRV